MFSIRVLPISQSDADGQRLGEITIDDFTEQFACHPVDATINEVESLWRRELLKLIGGAQVVALAHDPRFAWVIYREGHRCFVQQKLSLDGNFLEIALRKTETADGHTVSEWSTSVSDIERFLGA